VAHSTDVTPSPVRRSTPTGRPANAVREVVTSGLHGILIGAAVLTLIAFTASWLIREILLHDHTPSPGAPNPTPTQP
jgi:hypothetical protein